MLKRFNILYYALFELIELIAKFRKNSENFTLPKIAYGCFPLGHGLSTLNTTTTNPLNHPDIQ